MAFLEKDILESISQIRGKSKRPDVESIFKHLTSNNATNFTMEVVEESIKTLIAKSKVINKKTKQGLDSFFIIDEQTETVIETSDILNSLSCLHSDTPRKKGDASEETPISCSMKTPSLDSFKVEDFTARVVAIKAFFMNEIYELKQDIQQLKQKVNGENFVSDKNKNNIVENLELRISLLQQENSFLKTEMNQKQKTIDKLLDLNYFHSKDKYKVNDGNKSDKRNDEIVQHQRANPSSSIDDNIRQNHISGKPENNNNKNKRNIESKTKTMVVGDSMVKYLRGEDLSSKKNIVKIIAHPGSTTDDMLDYIKPVVRKKPDTLIFHTGTNDLTNGVNTMKKVRKLVKVVREIDESEEIKIGFSSVIYRQDKEVDDERKEVNSKLKKYCEGKGFVFIENANIDGTGLNNSKLHLNKKGTNILAENIKKSFQQF